MSRRFLSVPAQLVVTFALLLPLPAAASWPTDPLVNLPICTANGDQAPAAIVSDGLNGVFIAWADDRGGLPYPTGLDIYVQHVSAAGVVDPSWPVDGLAVCVADSLQNTPEIVADGSGGAIVVWEDFRNGKFDLYAQHVLATGAVDPGWPANGRALYTAGFAFDPLQAVPDGAGGAIVVWMDIRSGSRDIYAQRVLASGFVDPSWPTDGRALCTAANDQLAPTVVADGSGGAIVTWYDYRSDGDIYAQHVLGNGTVDPAWPVDGRALCTAVNGQFSPTIAADGAGGAIVTWGDFRNGTDSDIYAQRVLASGAVDPAWPADGRALCAATDGQTNPTITADGAGGAIVSWEDYRTGFPAIDVFAQHVQSNGAVDPAWPANGRALCLAADRQYAPTTLPDGAGGAIVIWTDYRSTGYPENADIYAQRVLNGGAVDPAWPADGRALSTATGLQLGHRGVPDGGGGAIVAWYDSRPVTHLDIYAQRVQANGQLGGDAPTPTLLSLVSAEADGQGVRLEWFTSAGPAMIATVYRRTRDTDWLPAASVHSDGTGAIHFRDIAVEPGDRYGYRLGVAGDGGEQYFGETWVQVPTVSGFSLDGVRPNPAPGDLIVSFSIPSAEPAALEVVDLAGRTVVRHSVETRPGSHVVNLRNGRTLSSGVYLVRLTQNGASVTMKACVLR